MKTLKLIAVFMMTAVLFSCSSLSTTSTTSTTSAAYTAGQTFGTSLKSLYSSYKSAGKLDVNNTTNLLNIATLANSCTTVKNQTKGTTTYKDFAKGAIVAGTGLITTSNVDDIISSVTSIAGLSDIKNSSAVSTSTSVLNSISSVLNAIQ